jgi:ArsR family transcriptional regulator, arsenate/arsenite/antimonite-responsive transcriptional repressor
MDSVYKALGDKNRRKILEILKEKDMSVSELLEHFPITQASLSHHLDALKRANLVLDERR